MAQANPKTAKLARTPRVYSLTGVFLALPALWMAADSLPAQEGRRVPSVKMASDDPGSGNPIRGQNIFQGKGGCVGCHRVVDTGSRTGPDLTEIGKERTLAYLEQSLTDPDADVLPQNRYYRVVTNDGKTITGRLLNIDTFTVQILDTHEQLQSLQKSDLRESGFLEKSPMPSYRTRLTPEERNDVIAYLASLKGLPQQ
jgi:putative heme-binding domain-containing protein